MQPKHRARRVAPRERALGDLLEQEEGFERVLRKKCVQSTHLDG